MGTIDKLIKVASSLYDRNEVELADTLDQIIDNHVIIEAGINVQAAECDQYKSGDHFKGEEGSGERWDNCIRYQKCKGKSEEAAKKICGYIAHRKKGGLRSQDVVRGQLNDVVNTLEAKGEGKLAKALQSAVREIK